MTLFTRYIVWGSVFWAAGLIDAEPSDRSSDSRDSLMVMKSVCQSVDPSMLHRPDSAIVFGMPVIQGNPDVDPKFAVNPLKNKPFKFSFQIPDSLWKFYRNRSRGDIIRPKH